MARTQFAVVVLGATQQKVSVNDMINAERLLAAAFGGVITLEQVPLVDTSTHSLVGRPLVLGASVTVRVAEQTQDAKIAIFKRKWLTRRRLTLCVLDGERVAHGGERGRDARPPAAPASRVARRSHTSTRR